MPAKVPRARRAAGPCRPCTTRRRCSSVSSASSRNFSARSIAWSTVDLDQTRSRVGAPRACSCSRLDVPALVAGSGRLRDPPTALSPSSPTRMRLPRTYLDVASRRRAHAFRAEARDHHTRNASGACRSLDCPMVQALAACRVVLPRNRVRRGRVRAIRRCRRSRPAPAIGLLHQRPRVLSDRLRSGRPRRAPRRRSLSLSSMRRFRTARARSSGFS